SEVTTNAQMVLDTAQLKITYTYKYVRDTTIASITNLRYTDEMTLLIGKNISKFYCYGAFQIDSLINECASGKMSISDYYGIKDNYKSGERTRIYKNYPQSKLTFTDRLSITNFLYQEDIPKQEWKIEKDTTTISGYKCQKATCTFRGREYIAWFTSEIKINTGPYKFWGLPGLIVNVYDTKKHYSFQLKEIMKSGELIVFEEQNYMKTNRKEYTRLFRKIRYEGDNFYREYEGLISGSTIDANGNEIKPPVWNTDIIEKE
ncbi:MAG: GLPGLI family protein, partial [Prevotellaceae bacterium]|nr:GLPGLI family protein [Prevotellaceae bacterium]